MALNCKPGDLAISVNTELPENNGVIVRVVRPFNGVSPWTWGTLPTWWCVSDELMTWKLISTDETFTGHEGPIPDRYLRPIRPDQPDEEQRDARPSETPMELPVTA